MDGLSPFSRRNENPTCPSRETGACNQEPGGAPTPSLAPRRPGPRLHLRLSPDQENELEPALRSLTKAGSHPGSPPSPASWRTSHVASLDLTFFIGSMVRTVPTAGDCCNERRVCGACSVLHGPLCVATCPARPPRAHRSPVQPQAGLQEPHSGRPCQPVCAQQMLSTDEQAKP